MIDIEQYKEFIPTNFSDNSKVWIYQSPRLLTISEALHIEPLLENFVANWQSHGVAVKGYANLLYGQFIVLIADESECLVGGCSTDTSVRLIKQISSDLHIDFFDRQMLAFVVRNKIETLPLNQINYALENAFIAANTLYFNNTVTTKHSLLHNWIIPVSKSWLATKFLKNQVFNN